VSLPPPCDGRIYTWTLDPGSTFGGCVTVTIAPLLRLDTQGEGRGRLWGRYVRVRNGGAVNELDPATGAVRSVPIGDAQPNAEGNFLFEPGRGGGRMDKVVLAKPHWRWRYIQASHFGEVNTYFHLDRIAAYVDALLHELGAQPLPCITAVVNAHHAATETDGIRDGVRRNERWLPFQGGHYRLPSRHFDIPEYEPISSNGEIHLGPGWQLLEHGALVEASGRRYRANASHNAGILYHEYGHHITRHTADFQANALRSPNRQNNRKTAMDEGTCDYWAATMLSTPHIWAWHRRHDAQEVHPRSLLSSKTMAEYDSRPGADPHANGTIWGAALWDLRTQVAANESDGVRRVDLLILKTLLLLGPRAEATHETSGSYERPYQPGRRDVSLPPSDSSLPPPFALGLRALLHADELLYAGRYRDPILATFSRRSIQPVQSMGTGTETEGCVDVSSGWSETW